ncbi:hypothetical protein F183_A16040 [Bryobacterales bacterium F-183]|nr:hypothetical protein F183_A16040 [Bryobacterales bacterium F-183]
MLDRAKVYIASVCAAGFFAAGSAILLNWQSSDVPHFLTILVLAIASSGLRVKLPSIPGTLSAVFVFQFLAIISMTESETLAIAWAAALAQYLWQARKRTTLEQAAFNVSVVSLSAQSAYFIYHQLGPMFGEWMMLAGLLIGALAAFLVNTFSVATVIALIEGEKPLDVWRKNYLFSFPYYLAGSALAGLLSVASQTFGWHTSLLILPVMYLFYRSFTTYTGRLEDAKNHAEEVSALHLRTIESLALAIEAKDDTTHAHLRRVQIYALALGEELGLKGTELDALRAAAILHDIGKLAVPEHIICKPGKLTHEEFEKMKIHPVVGAEILEHVHFPYPVAPIVAAHHEKWNGTGYPYGLAGENIPIGARILAAVDCLDALASDRQYRKALPIDEAMKVVVADSGKSFEPRIVEILQRRYQELEKKANAACVDLVKLSTNLKIERGDAPAAGFESSAPPPAGSGGLSFLQSIAEARAEVQELFALSGELGKSLSLVETLSLVSSRLNPLIPHQAMVLWVRRGTNLEAYYAQGANAALFRELKIPLGEGLAGWVAQNTKPIMNGNPAVEPGYLNNPAKFTTLGAALAVPLNGIGDFSGVIAFYAAERDFFQKDHLRILQGISSKLAASIENALAHATATDTVRVDALTGLPNLPSLLERFDAELSRAKRSGGKLAVLICDIDGLRNWTTQHGVAAANSTIERFASRLRGMFREYDLVARVGGDEFAIVVPDIGAEDLQPRLREIQILAMEAGRETCSDDHFSVTIGEAHYPADGDSVETLLSKADRKLCQLKKARPAAAAAAEAPKVVPAAEPAVKRMPPNVATPAGVASSPVAAVGS